MGGGAGLEFEMGRCYGLVWDRSGWTGSQLLLIAPSGTGDNLTWTDMVMGIVVGRRLDYNISGGNIATCTPSNPYCAMQSLLQ